ncbi:MAG: hotdog fold thioesterase [Anaerolineae bacterium]
MSEVVDHDTRQQIQQKISQDPFARRMGIELLELDEGYSKVTMSLEEDMINFHGTTHGAAIFALADAAFAAAGNSRGQTCVALTMNITYLSATEAGGRLYAEAREETPGGRTALYHITVTDESDRLIASCHAVLYRKDEWFVTSKR